MLMIYAALFGDGDLPIKALCVFQDALNLLGHFLAAFWYIPHIGKCQGTAQGRDNDKSDFIPLEFQ